MTENDEIARKAATELTAGLGSFWQERLGDDLIGFYLLGSLAHGGFNRRYSDIDVGLVAENGLTESDIATMRNEATRLSAALAPKLSLFWTDRHFSLGRFPPLDRLDYLDHATALTERERIIPARPTREDVRTYLKDAPFRNWAIAAERFSAIESLEPQDHKPFLRVFLYAARFAYSWQTGAMASNDTALAFLHETPPEGMDIALFDRALAVRHRAEDPDSLLPDRHSLPGLVEACRRLMER
tara:strand:+ start:958 stop:1683 length:726 start_codon:yes stop_codon:yes gene_type:complete